MSALTDNDIRQFETQLRAHREVLRETIHRALLDTRHEEYADLAGQVHDAGDESIAELLLGIDLSARSRELEEMQDTEAALERIKTGVFGVCIDCGADIDRQRLLAYATAKRCIACQTRREAARRGGKDATPSL